MATLLTSVSDDLDDRILRREPLSVVVPQDRLRRAQSRGRSFPTLPTGLAFNDVDGPLVPWTPLNSELFDRLIAAPWKVIFSKATALSPTASVQGLSKQELALGFNNAPRLRAISVLSLNNEGTLQTDCFDLDILAAADSVRLCQSILTGTLIGHDIGEEVYWLYEKVVDAPSSLKIIDTLLLSRVLRPDIPLLQAAMISDEKSTRHIRGEASAIFTSKDRTGWSLADVSLALFKKLLSTSVNKPKTWCKPVLEQADFDYLNDNVAVVHAVMSEVLKEAAPVNASEERLSFDIMAAYTAALPESAVLRRTEHQVEDIIKIRQKGLPWRGDVSFSYISKQGALVASLSAEIIKLEPSLAKWHSTFVDMTTGTPDDMRRDVGECFERLGLLIERSPFGTMKVGEKDLRRAKAEVTPSTQLLFKAWVTLQHAKRTAGTASEYARYAELSPDNRIRSLIKHGPITNRLSSEAPNGQACPSDEDFRDCIEACSNHSLISCDYSALDMRVGAALALRAQHRIHEVFEGKRQVSVDVSDLIIQISTGKVEVSQLQQREKEDAENFEKLKNTLRNASDSAGQRSVFWSDYKACQRACQLSRFARAFASVRQKALDAGTPDWSGLRAAFKTPGMDIHTWTALSMTGKDPMALFDGLSPEETVRQIKNQKEILGNARLSGKVANLSILYAMQDKGFKDAGGEQYNIHWSIEEARAERNGWLNTYVEIDLWHAWTELTPHGTIFVPDLRQTGKLTKKTVYGSETLEGRRVYAYSLNAALSYEDQSTGADILSSVVRTLNAEYPAIARCIVNQIHDELLFEAPDELVLEYEKTIQHVMKSCAEEFTLPYGVRCEVSIATAKTWVKEMPKSRTPPGSPFLSSSDAAPALINRFCARQRV